MARSLEAYRRGPEVLLNTPSARRTWFGDRSDKTRTLTMLYNEKPPWLRDARRTLDVTLFHAYGWDPGMDDKQLLDELLRLDLARDATPA